MCTASDTLWWCWNVFVSDRSSALVKFRPSGVVGKLTAVQRGRDAASFPFRPPSAIQLPCSNTVGVNLTLFYRPGELSRFSYDLNEEAQIRDRSSCFLKLNSCWVVWWNWLTAPTQVERFYSVPANKMTEIAWKTDVTGCLQVIKKSHRHVFIYVYEIFWRSKEMDA
jgi:hypothetical protein